MVEKMRPILFALLLATVGPLPLCKVTTAQELGEDATSLCAELIRPNGYTCTEYQTVTEDGFILGIQNIPAPRGQTATTGTGPVVHLQHGLIAGGDNWVDNSPTESLAFILADAGYDVWIANNRVVQWSHGHTTYTPSDDGYWAWTYDDLASYDLSATIQFVYNQRGGTKLTYIGHSQGTTLLLGGLTDANPTKNQILNCLRGAALLAPAAAASHISAPIIKASLSIYFDVLLPAIGIKSLNSNLFFNLTCTNPIIAAGACDDLFEGLLGQNSYIDTSRLPKYSQYYPQPTSSININHIGQTYRTGVFAKYDRGMAGNLAAYGQATPPVYDLSTFPGFLPLQLYAGTIDGIADPTDFASLIASLPNTNRSVFYLQNYGHIDFIWGLRAQYDVYPSVIQFLQTYG